MAQMRRKTLTVCPSCHDVIHGHPALNTAQVTREPRALKGARVVRRNQEKDLPHGRHLAARPILSEIDDRLAAEGLIEPLRTEQDGQLPARTVYAITDEGRRELRALRAEAWQEIRHRPDPVDLALTMSDDLDEDTLRGYLDDRIRVLSALTAQFDHERDRAWPDQTVADDLVIEHARLRISAELAWHQLVLDRLGKLAADSEHRGGA